MIGPEVLSQVEFWFLHALILLSLFALWGYLKSGRKYLVFFSVLSFYGVLCVALNALFGK